jgi:MYXO-CTERM domain-containing protein
MTACGCARAAIPAVPWDGMRIAPLLALAAGWLAPSLAIAEPPLFLPWVCDDVYHVTNGHQTSSHTGMDAWAWDFGMPVGSDVHAPADGVVRLVKMDSSQGGCDGAYANDANYVVVDFGDGTEALLMHLQQNSTDLQVGDVVAQGDVVGRVGLTGWVCGAHLHFQIQETCSSWWCQSIPAEFVGFGDPDEDEPMASNNCPVLEPCGARLDGTSTVIDDGDDRCFHRVTSWFWPGEGGWDDGHVYTWANAATEPDTIGRWEFAVDVPGQYRLEVHVPEAQAASQQAVYEIQTGAEVVSLGPVDQSAEAGWVDVGVLDIVAGDEHWVRLADNTGEDRALDRELAFDAIRWTWATESGGETSGGTGGSDEESGAPEDPGTSAGPPLPGETGQAPGDDSGSALPDAAQAEGGSSCAVADGRGAGGLGLLVLVAAVRRRRCSGTTLAPVDQSPRDASELRSPSTGASGDAGLPRSAAASSTVAAQRNP